MNAQSLISTQALDNRFVAEFEAEMERLKEIPVLMNEEWSLSAAVDDYYILQRKKKAKKVKREIQRVRRVNAGGNK